jgi:hypothetical protein
MRIERSITTVSWIPSDLLEGMGKIATRMKMAHHDPPPPDSFGTDIPAAIEGLRVNDRFRFANQLRAYIEVDDDGSITGCGYCGGGEIGATTVGLGVGSITIPATKLHDLQAEPEVSETSVRFTQTRRWEDGRADAARGQASAVRPVLGADRVDHPRAHDCGRRHSRCRDGRVIRVPTPLGVRRHRRAGRQEQRR